MTIEIPLTKGFVALVDDEDAEAVLAAGSWHALEAPTVTYAARRDPQPGKNVRVHLHTFLTGLLLVDHANGDGLDNRRANLREATRQQNAQNRRRRCDNRAGFKGVSKVYRRRNLWRAVIHVRGQQVSLGCFRTPEEAALAYDTAARDLFGEFAALNFPRVGERAA